MGKPFIVVGIFFSLLLSGLQLTVPPIMESDIQWRWWNFLGIPLVLQGPRVLFNYLQYEIVSLSWRSR